MNAHVTVLCLGDIFGRPGRKIVKERLPKLISDYQIDFVVANGENVAGGKGLNIKCANELFDAGVDVLTNGNHLMDNREILTLLEEDKRVIRPWNMKEKTPGSGFTVIQKNNVRYAVVNFMGTVLMPHDFSAFDRLDEKIRFIKGVSDICIVDMHAEASSEMRVMGFCWDGKASVVFGTHTHVPTADASDAAQTLATPVHRPCPAPTVPPLHDRPANAFRPD